jgi:thymidylate synthase (FAD)
MGRVGLDVRLVSCTPDAEHLVADAARLCYADDEVVKGLFDFDNIDEVDDARMISNLVKMGHMSPLEKAKYSFFVQGVSRALTHQLVRHRMASPTQRSQRYVEHGDFDFVVPESVVSAGLEGRFIEMMGTIGNFYDELRGGVPKEDARYVLPNACETKIEIDMNAVSLLNVFNKRLCFRAQGEIRELAENMYDLVSEVSPNIFRYAGPDCVRGDCRQLKMSCGRASEMREKYGK